MYIYHVYIYILPYWGWYNPYHPLPEPEESIEFKQIWQAASEKSYPFHIKSTTFHAIFVQLVVSVLKGNTPQPLVTQYDCTPNWTYPLIEPPNFLLSTLARWYTFVRILDNWLQLEPSLATDLFIGFPTSYLQRPGWLSWPWKRLVFQLGFKPSQILRQIYMKPLAGHLITWHSYREISWATAGNLILALWKRCTGRRSLWNKVENSFVTAKIMAGVRPQAIR